MLHSSKAILTYEIVVTIISLYKIFIPLYQACACTLQFKRNCSFHPSETIHSFFLHPVHWAFAKKKQLSQKCPYILIIMFSFIHKCSGSLSIWMSEPRKSVNVAYTRIENMII